VIVGAGVNLAIISELEQIYFDDRTMLNTGTENKVYDLRRFGFRIREPLMEIGGEIGCHDLGKCFRRFKADVEEDEDSNPPLESSVFSSAYRHAKRICRQRLNECSGGRKRACSCHSPPTTRKRTYKLIALDRSEVKLYRLHYFATVTLSLLTPYWICVYHCLKWSTQA